MVVQLDEILIIYARSRNSKRIFPLIIFELMNVCTFYGQLTNEKGEEN